MFVEGIANAKLIVEFCSKCLDRGRYILYQIHSLKIFPTATLLPLFEKIIYVYSSDIDFFDFRIKSFSTRTIFAKIWDLFLLKTDKFLLKLDIFVLKSPYYLQEYRFLLKIDPHSSSTEDETQQSP